MDRALLNKMDVYPADVTSENLIPQARGGESTLIKADISCFHEAPPVRAVASELEEAPIKSDYDQGFERGQEDAKAVYQETINVMQAALDGMQANLISISREIEASHLSSLASCLRAVFPALMRGGTDLELQSVLQNACSSALKGQIQLYVNPEDQSHCESFCKDRDILISVDEALQPLQMRLKWDGGGADIDCLSVATLCLERIGAAGPKISEDLLKGRSHD